MRKIAQKIEYSATLIYQHFADKEALLTELCRTDFQSLATTLAQLLSISDPLERIRQCGRAYIEFAVSHPNHYRLMFMTPYPIAPSEEDVAERKGNPNTDAYALISKLVEDAANADLIREPYKNDLPLVTQTLWAGVHGVAALEIACKCDGWMSWRTLEARTDGLINALLAGIFVENQTCRL